MKWATYDWTFMALDKRTLLKIGVAPAMFGRARPSIGIDNVRVSVED
jgi:hypothetical protein